MKTIVAALDKNNAIGKDGDLPWGRGLPADLAHFKRLTKNGSVIMGRKTFESIGHRPLPERENIVITSTPTGVAGVLSAGSFAAAMALARYEVFIIGGERVFEAARDEVDQMIITHVEAEFDGCDSFFPPIDTNVWHEVSRRQFSADEKNAYDFSIVTYRRR